MPSACSCFRCAENIPCKPQQDRSHTYMLSKLNHPRLEKANGGWKETPSFDMQHANLPGSSLSNPYNSIEPHRPVTLSFAQLLKCLGTYRSAPGYFLASPRGWKLHKQSTYKDREEKVDHGESFERIGGIFRSWIPKLSKSDCFLVVSSFAIVK